MEAKNQKIKEILLKGSYISEEDAKKAEEAIGKTKSSIIDYLLGEELITKDLLGQAIAEYFNIAYADLNSNVPNSEQILSIPEKIARKYRVVFFSEKDDELIVTTDNPTKKGTLEAVRSVFPNKNLTLAYSLTEDINSIFTHYRKPLSTRFSKIIKEEGGVAPKIIDEIVNDALSYKSSDVHFEPQRDDVIVRFRVDGVLREAGRIPKKYYENIVNKIKVESQIRIDEHFSAQDGAMRYSKNGNVVDLRISIVPTANGEKIVARLLSKYVQKFSLSDIGLSPEDQDRLSKASKKPFGMILVTGPTGSGKTTSLYAILKILNNPEVNITTIEDPIEYRIDRVNQIQVNNQTNLTFAKGLRSIVRQDPDVILVGEIRDKETTEIAVNAALTGHLLFSTFHANDAATSIPRLLDMGIEPFLLASTLELIVAQRLVRKICGHCRYSYKATVENMRGVADEIKKYVADGATLYKGKGCPACNHTGYDGRTAVFELISITPEMHDLILTNPSSGQIWDIAKSQGSKSLFEDGLIKVKNGITTLEEVARVAKPN